MTTSERLPDDLVEPYRDDDFAVWMWVLPVERADGAGPDVPEGAYVLCYVLARTKEMALRKAEHWLLTGDDFKPSTAPDEAPEFRGVWRAGEEPEDEDSQESESESLSQWQCVAEAWTGGGCLVFHSWDEEDEN